MPVIYLGEVGGRREAQERDNSVQTICTTLCIHAKAPTPSLHGIAVQERRNSKCMNIPYAVH